MRCSHFRILGVTQFVCLVALLSLATRPTAAEEPTKSGQADATERATQAISRGIDWLLRQQSPDGGWHSTTYGQMHSGVGNTALVLYALAHSPESLRARAQPAISRGLHFLLANLDQRGYVRARDGSADYPTYATALTLTAIERLSTKQWQDERRRMRAYLIEVQMSSDAGRDAGGWGAVGGSPEDAVPAEHANVSATRFVLEALRASGGLSEDAEHAALGFLAHCQNLTTDAQLDGGFFFTPDTDDSLNKAGLLEEKTMASRALSYGTATADGLCALATCGVPNRDLRVTSAISWLNNHPALGEVPGIPASGPRASSPRDGLKFYYYAALARAMREFPQAEFAKRRTALADVIVRQQQPDGSWTNLSHFMREDDPLVATALASLALSLSN